MDSHPKASDPLPSGLTLKTLNRKTVGSKVKRWSWNNITVR